MHIFNHSKIIQPARYNQLTVKKHIQKVLQHISYMKYTHNCLILYITDITN